MTLGERIEERRKALGIKSQSELARRAGVGQSTLSGLIRKPYRWSPYLTKIARELRTSVEYLSGDTDDPEIGALPPAPRPQIQIAMMPVALPSEAALAEMYEGQLKALSRLQGAELARALAKRLPRALARLQAAELYEETDDAPEASEASAPPAIDRPARRRAQRT